MNNKGVSIKYGDVAPEAKENFYPESSEQAFDTLAQLQQYKLNFPNYANPCELYSVVLDGTASAFPSVPENANLGLWSEQISNDDGTFKKVYENVLPIIKSNSVPIQYGYIKINDEIIYFDYQLEKEINIGDKITIFVGSDIANTQSLCEIILNGEVVSGYGEYSFECTNNINIHFSVSPHVATGTRFARARITTTEVITEEETPIVLTLTSEGQYSSQGLTFTFDTYNQIYPTHINIKWFRYADGTMEELSPDGGVDFYPDNAFYFCRNQVENYTKIVITFYSLNMPKNRLKLRVIDYGYGTFFYGDELRGVKLIQEIDPISTQISINTVDFTLDSLSDMEYSFQQKQPLSVFFNGELKSTTFVKKSTRKAKRLWRIQSEDYIGLLDSIPYYGGIYTNKNAVELLTDIFTIAKVPYSIDDVFADAVVTGYIPFTTCRNALMQVAFAIQSVVDTSNSEVVKVFALENDIKQTIPLNRIMQGQNFVDDETVTGIEVTVHSYKPITETVDVYDANEIGTGQNIFVKFSEPLHDLTITNGEIVSCETNYAVINANTGCVLCGQQYEHTTQTRRKNNPDVLASEIEKVVAVKSITLVSQYNIDNVIEKCYNWLTKTNTTNLKIVEGKHIQYGEPYRYGTGLKYGTRLKYGGKHPNIITYDEKVNVGENIKAETEYLGVVGGRLIKQSFNLNGNIIIKEAVLK